MRVADVVAQFIAEQCPHIFGVTGAGIIHLTDGIAQRSDLEWVALHDERSCAMAADAYSRASEYFGFCMVSTGPAATNAFTGVAGAWQDSVPMMVISGQVERAQMARGGVRQGGVQELTVIPMVKHITKYAVTVTEPDAILSELQKALYIAKASRPGPVWIEIPMDVQAAEVDNPWSFSEPDTPPPDLSLELHDVHFMLSKASRPIILAGQGARGLHLYEYGIPVVTTYLGIDTIEYDNPLCVGVVGIKGSQAANLAMQSADLILAIGTSLHNSVTGYRFKDFAPCAQLIVLTNDLSSQREEVKKRAYCIKADASYFMSQLELSAPIPDWIEQCLTWKSMYPVYKSDYSPHNIYSYIEELNHVIEPDAIVIADAGSAFYCTSQGIKIRPGQRYIPSGAMATMGFSVPAALGAHLATRRPVWAIIGDGSLQQCLAELACIRGKPIKIVVLRNHGYLSIRNSQKTYYNSRFIGCEPPMLDIPWIPEVVVAECLPDQEILPSVQAKIGPDGIMVSGKLEDMKR